jgi:hypothetical protein
MLASISSVQGSRRSSTIARSWSSALCPCTQRHHRSRLTLSAAAQHSIERGSVSIQATLLTHLSAQRWDHGLFCAQRMLSMLCPPHTCPDTVSQETVPDHGTEYLQVWALPPKTLVKRFNVRQTHAPATRATERCKACPATVWMRYGGCI